MSASNPALPSSVNRRFSQVYVEVPPSPISRFHAAHKAQPKNMHSSATQPHASTSTLKRKMSTVEVVITTPAKKAKMSIPAPAQHPSPVPKQHSAVVPGSMTGVNEKFPGGYQSCHQCRGKRDPSDIACCTFIQVRSNPCGIKYCKGCLKTRYGESLEEIKSNTDTQHEKGGMYQFKCPKCRDLCNCARCMKSKGLKPLGKFKGPPPEPVAAEKASTSNAVPMPTGRVTHSAALNVPQPRSLPTVKWTHVTKLSFEEAATRVQIREFMLRFSSIMQPTVAKSHLRELGVIGGAPLGDNEDGHSLFTWVSEACLKSLVLGLLSLFAYEEKGEPGKIIKTALKDIRASGTSLNKLWASLLRMRNALNECSSEVEETVQPSSTDSASSNSPVPIENNILSFADPHTPPRGSAMGPRQTRSNDSTVVTVNIACSAQMIPVLVGLINEALQTVRCSQEIEDGVKEGRDIVRDASAASKKENERWEALKASLTAEHSINDPIVEKSNVTALAETKAKGKENEKLKVNNKALHAEIKSNREIHKQKLVDIDYALKVVMPGYASRSVAPLGTDLQGRVYFALSPDAADRSAAFDLIPTSLEVSTASKKQRAKAKKRIPGRSIDERSAMSDWSLFLAVWGKEADGEVEGWWGFWEPEEIRNIAMWITIKDGLDLAGDDQRLPREDADATVAPPSRQQLQSLVKALKDFADTLEWRTRGDNEAISVDMLAAVPPATFYN